MKKIYLIFGVVVLAALIGGYFGYQYWQKGLPEYSLTQLRVALKNHDTAVASKFFDQESVWNNLWPRIKSKAIASDGSQNSTDRVLGANALEAQKGNSKDVFNNAAYNAIRGTTDKTTPSYIIVAFSILSDEKISGVSVNGGSGKLSTNYQKSSNYPVYKFDFVFTEQQDRTWRITDIQGLEDLMWAANDDKTRVTDLDSVAMHLNAYANETVIETLCGGCAADYCSAAHACLDKIGSDKRPYPKAKDWKELSQFLGTWTNGGKIYTIGPFSLPNDPLNRYGNTYYYAINDQNNPTEFVLKANLSDPDSSLLFSVDPGLVFSNILPEDKYFGMDCHKPAYCIGSPSLMHRLGIQYQ